MNESKNRSPQDRNRLRFEQSPYLLQHADNPVDWYPWGDEAFAKARMEQKPVFLSIGYSTCHWCHVMAHEVFNDPEAAGLMNDLFVSIKVDREERPDIDKVYMTVAQMMTGTGGWPLNVIMTPDKKPLFAATYIPKRGRGGMPGMMEIVPRIREIWERQRETALGLAENIAVSLRASAPSVSGAELCEADLKTVFERLTAEYDAEAGGFGGAPKFPLPHVYPFLLRYWRRTGDARALEMVEGSLAAMRRGGIYDHIGFGFHRYATDRRWLVPHFEKMLYDQAMLAIAYVEAFQATKKEEYRATAEEIFTYVLRDMTSPEGGFYSAEDADTEGEEGKFYLWSRAELDNLLGVEADTVAELFNVKAEGNFRDSVSGEQGGGNIFHLEKPLAEVAVARGVDPASLSRIVADARTKLLECRNARSKPHRDDKILTDWNGLMIAALAIGARALERPVYADAARKAADFILATLRDGDGTLLHRYRNGDAAIPANLDDYAFLAWGCLELYGATFDTAMLSTAKELTDDMLERFHDADGGGFFFTAFTAEELLVRSNDTADGPVPSGNSVAMNVMLRLGRMLADPRLEECALETERRFAKGAASNPTFFTHFLSAVDFRIGPTHEVVVCGDATADDTKAVLSALATSFLPRAVALFRPSGAAGDGIARLAPYLDPYETREGKATIYVCRDRTCGLPVTGIDAMFARFADV